ncbi:MAG: glycosyltransferase [Anaerolineae bacterium]|nr:glycosyltransferase [Anaerolineae bacterium]
MSFQISVVIPVYNAARYVRAAVDSALSQPETGEVILVEDASPDDALAVCEQLAHEYDNVHLLRHPNGENRGAGASRNLGILNAKYEIIAFLDADDVYLPDRFSVAAQILTEQPDVDGVYEVLKMHYENEDAHIEWRQRSPEVYARGLIGPRVAIPPEHLFTALLEKRSVFFSSNGLTIRRAALHQVGLYPEVRRSEDALMCFRLAAKTRLVAGRLDEPVALYRVYGANRGSLLEMPPHKIKARQLLYWREAWRWSLKNLPARHQNEIFSELYRVLPHVYPNTARLVPFRVFSVLTKLAFNSPHALMQGYFWRGWLRAFPLFPYLRAGANRLYAQKS